jgi:HK97 gp10 family phage protein
MEVACDVSGIIETQAAFLKLDSGLQSQVNTFLSIWAVQVRELAMQLVPVRTGYLRSTIKAEVKNWVATVGADATYAYFVEFGTRYIKAQPYLVPALEQYLPQLEAIILQAIDQATSMAGFESNYASFVNGVEAGLF